MIEIDPTRIELTHDGVPCVTPCSCLIKMDPGPKGHCHGGHPPGPGGPHPGHGPGHPPGACPNPGPGGHPHGHDPHHPPKGGHPPGPGGHPLAQDIPLVHITEETDENRTQDEEPSWIALLTWNQAGTRIFSS
uniref:Proline, histidine and glycine-rich protein 1 n=1 Tax=Castor canadensis TaxID=51338 RepID=A0A8B7UP50_CASCN|nr:proline, histidine and glycine-rich protein 1 [Castor canadensis]